METQEKNCDWNKCKVSEDLIAVETFNLCAFHKKGGIFNTGALFEQYAIIEEDFITILKYIPLQKENFGIASPRFSDLLIRCCVAIEIFFKEWINHYRYSENIDVIELRKKKKLNISDFNKVFSPILKDSKLFVRQLDEDIFPFENWEEHNAPSWWNCYNNIKHHNTEKENTATMEMAMNSLAALFILHCEQTDCLKYLYKFSSTNLISIQWVRLKYIKTPLESRRYLFLYKIPEKSPGHGSWQS